MAHESAAMAGNDSRKCTWLAAAALAEDAFRMVGVAFLHSSVPQAPTTAATVLSLLLRSRTIACQTTFAVTSRPNCLAPTSTLDAARPTCDSGQAGRSNAPDRIVGGALHCTPFESDRCTGPYFVAIAAAPSCERIARMPCARHVPQDTGGIDHPTLTGRLRTESFCAREEVHVAHQRNRSHRNDESRHR
jgi:hypothetical protein